MQGSYGQLSVTPGSSLGMTPLEFIQNHLVGTGITILPGATFNGSTEPLNSPLRPALTQDQVGSFTTTGGAATQLGIDGGVILSSGKVQNTIAGRPTSNATGGDGDPDLFILAGVDDFDKSVLEFDFIPETDVMTFRYVFSSVEFDTYCGEQFNDAFGLFLSGPNIRGGLGFQNDAVNIARLPDGSSYVNIHNICAADEGNTGFGKYSWWTPEPHVYFSYNRFTYVYVASYPVECGETYHMKFAIGDAGDHGWDSGVFLEQNSFSSNNFTPTLDFSNPETGELLIPGCSNLDLSYTIPHEKTTDLIIDLEISPSGTATQADNLPNPFPPQVVIPAGQTQSPAITIEALPAAIPGPDKTLIIKAFVTTCAVLNTATSSFTIRYHEILSVNAPPVTTCSGETATLATTVYGGQVFLSSNSYHYLWSTGATTSAISVNPGPGHHVYSVSVTDACGQTATAQTWVDAGTIPGPAGIINGTAAICTPAFGYVFSIDEIPGADGYIWAIPAGASIISGNNTHSIAVDFSTSAISANISVRGHNTYCGDGTGSDLPLVIYPNPEAAGPISGNNMVCQGPSSLVYSIAPLAYATSYDWLLPPGVTIVSGSGTNQISCLFTSSAVSGNFTVRGQNTECGFGDPSTLAVSITPLPGDAGTISSMNGSEVCRQQTGVAYSIPPIPNVSVYLWNYTGTGANLTSNGPDLLIDFSTTATSGILSVKGQNSCGDGMLSSPFFIMVKPKPAVEFTVCNTIITTKNGRPILLKGGTPTGSNGVYSGPGVSMVSPQNYVFDPASSSVVGGNASNGADNLVKYSYTNSQGCSDDQTIAITVYGSNAGDPCPGIVKDHRDNKIYPTFIPGPGSNSSCWMAANLNYGAFRNTATVQTDNCIVEKYCPGNNEAQCESEGGFYQWKEIMEYQQSNNFQDICPAGWHVPSSLEWEGLIDAVTGLTSGDGLAGSFLMYPTGFFALPGGICYLDHSWAFTTGSPVASMFWTSTPNGIKPVARGINTINQSVSKYESSGTNAFLVRCVKN
ncbi:MAG: choice-of-anchor L domain-containing protein [Bacteroidetes bacterium]|nr:choice-of-anchor L domain-containing protein [Bacteroidota bacterium]